MNKIYFVSYTYRTAKYSEGAEKYDHNIKFGNVTINYASRLQTPKDIEDFHLFLEKQLRLDELIIINFFEL